MTFDTDLAVIGGGIMGCGVALRVAEGGMRPLVLEQGEVGGGASGVNAGTLSVQIKRVKLMPYALRGREMWEQAGAAVGYRRTGGFTLAFNEREEKLLLELSALKRAAGAPIEIVSPNRVAEAEPGLSRRIRLAAYCPLDGHANSSVTGSYYRARMDAAGVPYRQGCRVTAIERLSQGFRLETSQGEVRAARLLLACGAWLKGAAAMIGLHLPVRARVNIVSVTERGPRLVQGVIGHATGLLTLKQKANGSVLIGGGWQGAGTPQDGRGHVVADNVLPNLRLAQFAVPGLTGFRILRSWTGFEGNVPDFYPLAGALPGVPDAFVLGCVRGGYTIGPYISEVMGDFILGREPEMPLFDPGRGYTTETAAA